MPLIALFGPSALSWVLGDLRKAHLFLYPTFKLCPLVKRGNSVIVIEHDPTVLSYCDWLIELGPGGGSEGGEIIAQGSPFDLKQNLRSQTGPFLETRSL